MSWGKIAVSVRSSNGGDPLWLSSWTKFIREGLRKGDEVLQPVTELPHHYAANCIGNNFLAGKCDTLLMVDDDMVFKADTLERLRSDKRTWNFDMVQAMYMSRRPPHNPSFIAIDETSPTGCRINPKPPKDVCAEVGVVGFAFTLIRRTVFEKLLSEKPDNRTLFYWGENGDSEDACFCFDARNAGFKIGCHTGITVGHRVKMVLDWSQDRQALEVKTRSIS